MKLKIKTMLYALLATGAPIAMGATLEGAHCGTREAMDQFYTQRPESLSEAMAFAQKKFARPKSSSSLRTLNAEKGVEQKLLAEPTYVIPVVFHVYGTNFNGYSVNDQLIEDALRKTNEDFQGLAPDFDSIISEFAGVKDTLSVEFRLAKIDPNGNATTGIVYHANACGAGNYGDSNVANDNWNNYKYMNVYIQNDLYCDGYTTNSGVAWYPDTYMSNQGIARVTYNGAYLGNNTSENFRSVLTHEFGHFLNLIHTFQGGCSNGNVNRCSTTGDEICDTPQVDNSGLQSYNCLGQMTNWQNFMHYSDQYANFTIDQVNRMHNAMNHAARSSLWTQQNLIDTGTYSGGGNQLPTADVNGPYSAQTGAAVNFTSAGSSDADGSIVSYFWEFGDGATSSTANPSHAYNSAGTFTVRLTVTDNDGATNTATTSAQISAADQGLQNGVPVTGLAESTGNDRVFFIDLPANVSELSFVISGGSGDADLYTLQGAVPTDATYDCRPYIGGNNETCSHPNPQSGRWYARVKAYSTFSGVSLTANYSISGGNESPTASINGPYSGTANSSVAFSSAGSIDPDGSIVSYAWTFGDGNSSVSANPQHVYASAGNYTVSLTVTDDQGASHSASTTASISGGSSNGLVDACATQGPVDYVNTESAAPLCVTSGNGGNLYFYFYNNGTGSGTIRTEHGSGDVSVYYSGNGWPSTTNYQLRSVNSGNTEEIQVSNLASGWNYIMLRGTHSGVTLQVDY